MDARPALASSGVICRRDVPQGMRVAGRNIRTCWPPVRAPCLVRLGGRVVGEQHAGDMPFENHLHDLHAVIGKPPGAMSRQATRSRCAQTWPSPEFPRAISHHRARRRRLARPSTSRNWSKRAPRRTHRHTAAHKRGLTSCAWKRGCAPPSGTSTSWTGWVGRATSSSAPSSRERCSLMGADCLAADLRPHRPLDGGEDLGTGHGPIVAVRSYMCPEGKVHADATGLGG